MTLELTTKFKGISTSPAARKQCATATVALKRCYAALNYISRDQATGNIYWAGLCRADGSPAQSPKEARGALRQRFRDEAAKGGRVGRRVATTGIVSLPNSWGDEVIKVAMKRLAQELAPPDAMASVLIVHHIDKANNAHLHFVAVDGEESHEAAKRRAKPDAQRIRRQNVQRFNERGAPKRWRKRIADVLNTTADDYAVAGVEWRSFKERGLRRMATTHDGAEKRAREAREKKRKAIADFLNAADGLDDSLADLWKAAPMAVKAADEITRSNGGEQRQRE